MAEGAAGDPFAGRCGSCGAYIRMGEMPGRGPVGKCAKEVFAFPLGASSTCGQYRPRHAPPPLVAVRKARVAGAPRDHAVSAVAPRPALPSEIDLEMDAETFRSVLTQVLREELGTSEVELGGKWQGGEMVLKPGREGVAEKRIPIEAFFHKIVMVRDKLRVLEQRLNGSDKLSDEDKVAMQQYITACYGSLTTFNALFADTKKDGFRGAAGKEE